MLSENQGALLKQKPGSLVDSDLQNDTIGRLFDKDSENVNRETIDRQAWVSTWFFIKARIRYKG